MIIIDAPWFVRKTELQDNLQRLFLLDDFSRLAEMACDRTAISGHPIIIIPGGVSARPTFTQTKGAQYHLTP